MPPTAASAHFCQNTVKIEQSLQSYSHRDGWDTGDADPCEQTENAAQWVQSTWVHPGAHTEGFLRTRKARCGQHVSVRDGQGKPALSEPRQQVPVGSVDAGGSEWGRGWGRRQLRLQSRVSSGCWSAPPGELREHQSPRIRISSEWALSSRALSLIITRWFQCGAKFENQGSGEMLSDRAFNCPVQCYTTRCVSHR